MGDKGGGGDWVGKEGGGQVCGSPLDGGGPAALVPKAWAAGMRQADLSVQLSFWQKK